MLRFDLENIGPISKASVEVGGLTVITGTNGTGKSFVSKAIHTVAQTFQDYPRMFFYDQVRPSLFYPVSDLFEFEIDGYKRNVAMLIYKIFLNLDLLFESNFDHNEYLPLMQKEFNEFYEKLKSDPKLSLPKLEKFKLDVNKKFEDLKQVSFLDQFKDRFDLLLELNFSSQFNSFIDSNRASIEIFSEKQKTCSIQIEGNKITNSELDRKNIQYTDNLYIDSPLYMSLFGFLNKILAESSLNGEIRERNHSLGLSGNLSPLTVRRDFPFYLKKLLEKATSQLVVNVDDDLQKVFDQTGILFGGEVEYNSDANDFILKRGSLPPIKSKNMASGIKALGLIQSLIKTNGINKNSLLIIDEPENHLHPEWQVEYAKVLVKLVEAGVPIIVSSHSPYMLEALKTFSDKSSIKDKTKFYFGKMQEQGSVFEDVTEDLEPIFDSLSKPMRKLAFE